MSLTLGIGRSFRRSSASGMPVTTQIALSPSALGISPGDTGFMVAVAEASDGTPTGDTVTYHTSDPNIATIDASTGAYAYITAGTANFTATSGGVTSNTVVVTARTVAQRVVAALGGDANVGGIFLDTDGITNTSGRASAWKDARGGSFPTMAEVSSSGPTITGGQLVFDGTNYLTVASALITGTDNWAMITIRQDEINSFDGSQIIAAVGDGGSSGGMSIAQSTAAGGPTSGLLESLGGLNHGVAWISSSKRASTEVQSGSTGFSVLVDQTFRRLAGSTTTFYQGTDLGVAVTNAPGAPGAVSYIGWNNAHAKFKGTIRAVVFVKVLTSDAALNSALAILRSTYGFSALFSSFAIPTTGWESLASTCPLALTFGDWTASQASEGGLPVIDPTPPNGMDPAVKINYLVTNFSGGGTPADRNAGIDGTPSLALTRGYVQRLTMRIQFDPSVDLTANTPQRKTQYFQSPGNSDGYAAISSSFSGSLSTITDGGGIQFVGPNIAPLQYVANHIYTYTIYVALESGFGVGDGYFRIEIDSVVYHEDFNVHFSSPSWIGVRDPTLQAWAKLRVGAQFDILGNAQEYRWVIVDSWERALKV